MQYCAVVKRTLKALIYVFLLSKREVLWRCLIWGFGPSYFSIRHLILPLKVYYVPSKTCTSSLVFVGRYGVIE